MPLAYTEIILRLPSVIFGVACLILVFKISRYFFNREAAWFSVLVFACLDEVIEASTMARPYALAQLCALWSTYELMRWLHDRKRLSKYLYALAYVLTVYASFLFGGIILIHLVYVLIFRRELSFSKPFWAVLYVLIGLVPVIPQVSSMLDKREAMAIASMPSWYHLLLAWIPLIPGISLAIAYFFSIAISARFQKGHDMSKEGAASQTTLVFVLSWMILPWVAIVVASWMLGSSLFVPRYVAWSAPGVALLAAYFFQNRVRAEARLWLVVFFVVFSIAAEFTKQRSFEDWRSATERVRQLQGSVSAPVLLYSGVIESSRVEWLSDPIKRGQFLSPVLYYTVAGPTVLLPFSFESSEAERYWQESVLPEIPRHGQFLVLLLDNLSWTSSDGDLRFIGEEVEHKLIETGANLVSKEAFGRVQVMLFERLAPETLPANGPNA